MFVVAANWIMASTTAGSSTLYSVAPVVANDGVVAPAAASARPCSLPDAIYCNKCGLVSKEPDHVGLHLASKFCTKVYYLIHAAALS
jgi:hypothetical protein